MSTRILQINTNRSRPAHDMALATAIEMDAGILVLSEPNIKSVKTPDTRRRAVQDKQKEKQHTKIRILQGNTDRGKAALDLVHKIAEEKNVDIIIMAEPNKKKTCQSDWITDNRIDVAIKVRNKNLTVRNTGKGNGFVYIETQTTAIYGCYISPNIDIQLFTDFLQELRNDMKTKRKEIIVGGDFNAKSPQWGSKYEDKRGQIFTEWLAEEDLIVHNRGDVPTFVRGNSESFIDVTFSTNKIASQISNWKVLEEESLSCHQHIYWEIGEQPPILMARDSRQKGMWRLTGTGLSKMIEEVGRTVQNISERVTVNELLKIIDTACVKAFPRKSKDSRKSVYWWNNEIAEKRKESLKNKRALVRANKGGDEAQKLRCRENYGTARTTLKKAITRAKNQAWQKIIEEVDKDVWGRGYQIVMKKFRRRPAVKMTDEQQLEIAKRLFPQHERTRWNKAEVRREDVPPFTMQEIERATNKLKEKKAPGPDNIPAEVIKAISKEHSKIILDAMNNTLMLGVFPKKLKDARLILIEKETKLGQQDKAYRPICLLNTMGKLLEQLLLERLRVEIKNHGGLADEQYGFREKRSTISALTRVKTIAEAAYKAPYSSRRLCAIVTVDVQNAFNSAPWRGIMKELEDRKISPYLYNIIADYFEGRKLVIGENSELDMTCGVPQGSVLGPTLWNVYYDNLFKVPMPDGVTLVGYADDVAIVIEAKRAEILETLAKHALHNVTEWLYSKNLKIAPQKTEAVIMYGGRKVKSISIELEDIHLNSQESLKYLGIHLDRNLRMGEHIRRTAQRAANTLSGISRLMPNCGGPNENNRRLLCSVAQSIMLYGASIWESAMNKDIYRKEFISVQRKAALRIVRAYRTTSTEALLVLARMPPIDLVVKFRAQVEREGKGVKQAEYSTMMDKWQERWQKNVDVAQWTKTLIPDLRTWSGRKHGETNFHLTQFLTGHGCFRAYLHRFKLHEDEQCIYCGERDTAEHTLFVCHKWDTLRTTAEASIGRLSPQNIVDKMLEDGEKWETICKLTGGIMCQKIVDMKREPEHP